MNASSKIQKEAGIEDDKFLRRDLQRGGKEKNDPELLRFLLDHSAGAIDWLDSMNDGLDNPTTAGGMSVKRTHRPHLMVLGWGLLSRKASTLT